MEKKLFFTRIFVYMNVILVFSILATIINTSSAVRNPRGGPRSAGRHGQFPYVVALQSLFHVEGTYKSERIQCTGSIISPRWILTSAQCVNQPKLNFIAIQYQSGNIVIHPDTWEQIKSVIEHPLFHREFKTLDNKTIEINYNDIALLETKNEMKFDMHKKAVCFSDKRQFEGECYAVGFDDLKIPKENPNNLNYSISYIPLNYELENDPRGRPQMIAVKINSQVSPSPGDTGGPVMCDNRQFGLLSEVFLDVIKNIHISYTACEKYRDWIETTTGIDYNSCGKPLSKQEKNSSDTPNVDHYISILLTFLSLKGSTPFYLFGYF